MKIGILAAGTTPEELTAQYDTYAGMMMGLLDRSGSDFSYQVYDVRDGDFPQSIDECDGWGITGSKFSVYEDQPWMLELQGFIRALNDAEKPLIGICFGHQIIAQALGGKVEKYSGGWGLGMQDYQIVQSPLTKTAHVAPASFCLNAIHQDQVTVKPEQAEVFASSDFCRFAGLRYGNRILTVQAHPEFSQEFEQALLQSRKGSVLPEQLTDQALTTVSSDSPLPDSDLIGGWMAACLQGEL